MSVATVARWNDLDSQILSTEGYRPLKPSGSIEDSTWGQMIPACDDKVKGESQLAGQQDFISRTCS